MRSSRPRSRIDPVNSRSTLPASDGSSGLTSSVTMARSPRSASRAISPWPISPPAPVMSTTGLRTRGIIVGEGHARHVMPSRSIAPSVLAFALPQPPLRIRHDLHRRDDARGLLPHRRSEGRGDHRARSRRLRWRRGRAAARSSSTRRTSAITASRCATATRISLLYSRGFASVFGEWETTDEAKTAQRTFHESVRFPWPKEPVHRGAQEARGGQRFQQLWSTMIDPSSRFVDPRAAASAAGRVWTVIENGPPAEKVDLLVIGEGYTRARAAEVSRATSSGCCGKLFARSRSRAGRRISTCARSICRRPDSGVHRPTHGRQPPHADPARVQHLRFGALRADARQSRAARRGVVRAVRVHRDPRQREDSTAAAGSSTIRRRRRVDSAFSDVRVRPRVRSPLRGAGRRVLHVRCRTRPARREHPEPWEPNVTALHDPAQLKWKDLVDAGHAAADAVGQGGVREAQPRDSEASGATSARAMRRKRRWTSSSREERDVGHEVPRRRQKYAGKVGAFEGAAYEARGLYRPRGRLHHVHARRGRVLPRVPAGRSSGSSICTRR